MTDNIQLETIEGLLQEFAIVVSALDKTAIEDLIKNLQAPADQYGCPPSSIEVEAADTIKTLFSLLQTLKEGIEKYYVLNEDGSFQYWTQEDFHFGKLLKFYTTPEQIARLPKIKDVMLNFGLDSKIVERACAIATFDQGMFDLIEQWVDFTDERNFILEDINKSIKDWSVRCNKCGNLDNEGGPICHCGGSFQTR